MNSLPDTPRVNKNFYTKMSATATKHFSEEMQKRRKPFLLNETEPINARISIKKSNKENAVQPSSSYNKNYLNKTSQLPGKNSINIAQYRTNMDCPVLHKYHHNSSEALREIDSNTKATYPDSSPGKIEIENIPIKSNCVAKETVPISNYQGKTSIDLYQASMQNNENENFTSDVEQLLKMHKEMTDLKQKLEEKYKNTLKHRDQLISYGTNTNGEHWTETDNIVATIHEKIENEAKNFQKITPTNLQGTSELLTTATLLSLAKASGIETQSQQRLSLITDETCNLKKETLNESVKLFTKLLKPKETNANETNELQTFTEVTSKESFIAAETGNSKKETLIRKINLLRHVMVLTSTVTGGNDTSGYQSITEEDFNNYKTECLINSTPLTTTVTNAIKASGNETLNKMVGNENIETEGVTFEPITNSLLFATVETAGNEICNKIYSTVVKEKTPAETSGNETARSQSLLALITKEMNNIGEEDLNTLLNFLKSALETNGNEELNKENCNCEYLTKDKGLQAIQITITVKETKGIETPRYLTQLIPELNKTQNVSADKVVISKESNGNGTPQSLKNQYLRQSRLKRNLPYICNKIKTISRIPNEIIKIPKKYLTYRGAQNTENSFINKENGNKAIASQGDDGEKEFGKNSLVKLKCLHNLKNFVNPKGSKNDEEQKGRHEMEHFKQIERKNEAMAELPGQEFCRKLPGKGGPKQINVEQFGGMLHGLWDAVKKYPFEAHVNIRNENKRDRESGESREQLSNRRENREMEIESENILKDKREEKINERDKNVEILEEKREDKIQEREMKCEKNEGENFVQKQEMMPKGSQYSIVGKIPKKKYSFRKRLRNCFTKEEKTNDTAAKNSEEDCATQENDSDDRNEIDRMAEHFSQMFHI